MDAKGTGFYREWLTPTLTKAGIEEYHWHSNRHTCGSWQARAGSSIKVIPVLVGHKAIVMAARYQHLSAAHTAGASGRMVKWKSEQPRPGPTATETSTTQERPLIVDRSVYAYVIFLFGARRGT